MFLDELHQNLYSTQERGYDVWALPFLGFLGAKVCRATICNKLQKVSAALAAPIDELIDALPEQEHLNIDETGHKAPPFDKPEGHKRHWIWVFVASNLHGLQDLRHSLHRRAAPGAGQ